MRRFIFIILVFFVSNSAVFADSFDFNAFNADRSNCYKNRGNISCFQSLMYKYSGANGYYTNILHFDCGVILKDEKKYTEAINEFDYVLQNEKRNPKLLSIAKKEKANVVELLQKMENAKRNDYGDYYNQQKSILWKNPGDIKVYISNHYEKSFGKSYVYRKAFQIWENDAGGLFHFTFVSSEDDADIICDITEKIAPEVNGITNTGPLVEINGVTYFQKAKVTLSLTNGRGVNNTDAILLTTALHEIGHALGINYHSDNINDIMYYEVHTYRTDTLSKRDINTLKRIYW